jgi:hypothetical protein
MASESASLPEIVATIMRLCREQRTGTLFVKSGHRLVGQVGIENGDIVFLFSLGKRGMAALPVLLSATDGGNVTFVAGPVQIKLPLPPTSEILQYLSEQLAAAGPADKAAFRADEHLSAATRTVLESTLREFIGPIAGMVCADTFRKASSVEVVIAALIQELPSRDMADRFRDLVRQRLG